MFLALKDIGKLPEWFFYPGIIIIVAGIFVRQWAILTLGRFYNTTISMQRDHNVVDNGPYRYVRHPSYLGLFIIAAGIGVALQSGAGLLVIFALVGLAVWYRVHVEEKFLVSGLGEDYVRYMERTKRLIPFLF